MLKSVHSGWKTKFFIYSRLFRGKVLVSLNSPPPTKTPACHWSAEGKGEYNQGTIHMCMKMS